VRADEFVIVAHDFIDSSGRFLGSVSMASTVILSFEPNSTSTGMLDAETLMKRE
jgi:hypothetical protein